MKRPVTIKEKDSPFLYQRGRLKIIGYTAKDRNCMMMDNIFYWAWRIILAIAFIIMILKR